MRCRVADDPVVAINSRPVKAGNSLEDKTGKTLRLVAVGHGAPKAAMWCEGVKTDQGMLKVGERGNVKEQTIKAEMLWGERIL